MKKSLFVFSLLLLAAFVLMPSVKTVNAANEEVLNIINWGDYIDEDMLNNNFKEFVDYYKAETGKTIRVNYREYDTNEIMLTQVMNGASIDMLAPSEYAIQKLLEKGMLQKIGDKKEALWNGIEPMFKEHIDETFGDLTINGETVDMTDYFVPYMWGTLGILYNKDVVTQADLAEGWGLLWNKAGNSQLVGKIYMKDSIRDVYVAAVMYLKENNRLPAGFETMEVAKLINSTAQELIDAAEEVLIEQKEQKVLYSVDFDKEELIAGNAYLDLAWSGDAVYAIEEAKNNGINLDYYVPESGSNIWFDGWVITKNAQNPEAAKMFIEFMNRPENAVRNMIAIGYTSGVAKSVLEASDEVKTILEENEYDVEEFFANQVQYFNGTMPMGVMKDFGTSEEKLINMWESVKVYGNDPLTLVLIIVGVAVVIGVVIGVIVVFKNKSNKRRRVN